jgi:Domain of unknown function (DUF4249)
MKRVGIYSLVMIAIAVVFFSCEDVIDPNLEKADPILSVDAWVTNKPGVQTIKLNYTVAYDDNSQLPPAASTALVQVTSNTGKVYNFIENTTKKDGSYEWTPSSSSETFGKIGERYTLSIVLKGETFSATSSMAAVPAVDSLVFEFEDTSSPRGNKGYQAQFWARDLPGVGNLYWIRAYKNSIPLSKPDEINTSYDGGLAAGSGNDGKFFLPPIRSGVNPRDEDADGNALAPYAVNDSLYVEIHSLTLQSFNYLKEVKDNTDRQTGFASLFSKPMTNVSTNIVNQNAKGSQVVGFFNVAAVSGRGKKFKK